MSLGSDTRPAARDFRGPAAVRETSRLPLGALRFYLDEASAGTRWTMNPDGVRGRALWMDAGSHASYPLLIGTEMRLDARVMLLPHDWRDGGGAVRATVTAFGPEGLARVLWSGELRAGDRGRPGGLEVRCVVPATTRLLSLGLHVGGPPQPRHVMRAVWVDPTLNGGRAVTCGAAPLGTASKDGSATRLSGGRAGPLISVLTPVHNPPLHMLEEAIASVTEQTYPHWELCLVDDGSSDPQIINALQHHAASNPRIHLARHDTAGGISAATNRALQLATGDYIALLDHDDTLTPDALQHVADHITADPTLDMLYSDEDILLDGRQIWVHIKPAWSPDTLRTNGYTCHLGVYRRRLVEDIGGFRTEFNGSQDVDMILRLSERTDRITNIPRVLYHWRAHASSTAGGDAKPYAYVAARNAIAAHLDRLGLDAEVGYGPPGLYRVAHRLDPATTVDIALAVTALDGLHDAARSWSDQPHPSWRLTISAAPSLHASVSETLIDAGIPEDRIILASTPADADPAQALAAATALGVSEHLLMMTSPAQGLTHDWLTRLLGYSHQPGIDAAGPVVLAPDGRIQHAGIAMPAGLPLHLLHGSRSSMDHFFGYGTSVYNVLALSGVVMTRRTSFAKAGGLDPTLGELALIGYCLKTTAKSARAVIVPDARMRTTGPDPTVNDVPAVNRLRCQWAGTHGADPYYNPNYRTDRGDFEVLTP
jgi:hypothetical protein